MAITETQLLAIKEILRDRPDGVSMRDLVGVGASSAQRRSMQRRLQKLIEREDIVIVGANKGARYYWAEHVQLSPPPPPTAVVETDENDSSVTVPLSREGEEVRHLISKAHFERPPVGYRHEFLATYKPNVTAYLPDAVRHHLASVGITGPDQPAGTYVRQILSRLLIDLSWNSSRLEGNTYSILDTLVLLQKGKEAEGKTAQETQMILNHKEAIEYLVDDASEAGFNRHTILNLHALLSNNLLPDPMAQGRLRHSIVGISHSAFSPLSTPALIEEYFAELLAKAEAISNPFEQSFFISVHLPYLQPFEDVNKRVSRLAANLPLFKKNLSPISFIDVPEQIYIGGLLGVYELNRIELARDVYIWAYERSARRYAAIRQSIGEPDQFRLRYREELRSIIATVIGQKRGKAAASRLIGAFAAKEIPAVDIPRFTEVAQTELIGLHEGNFARFKVRPSEFFEWKAVWETS